MDKVTTNIIDYIKDAIKDDIVNNFDQDTYYYENYLEVIVENKYYIYLNYQASTNTISEPIFEPPCSGEYCFTIESVNVEYVYNSKDTELENIKDFLNNYFKNKDIILC